MAKICTLFSGSSGNCTLISCGEQAVLVDAGVSCKRILESLNERNIDKDAVKGIFITHCHSDHIKGLKVLLSKLKIPMYASKETLDFLMEKEMLSGDSIFYDIEDTINFPFDINAEFFRTSHDCPGSGGYIFSLNNGDKAAVCTDLGYVSDDIRNKIAGCKAVVIESNHDVGMLQNGRYPFETKQRILSDKGHLSNVSCACELPGFVNVGTTHIILSHLSRENNTPELARVTSESVLFENGMKSMDDYMLYVAPASGGKIVYF